MITNDRILIVEPLFWKQCLELIAAKIGSMSPSIQKINGTAIIQITGLLMPVVPQYLKDFGFNATSYEDIANQVNAAVADPNVKDILLHVDSGGGFVSGVTVAADAIFNARSKKPVNAFVVNMAASGAYWLVSQADRIFATPVAQIGGIGVYTTISENAAGGAVVLRSGPLKGIGEDTITSDQMAVLQENIDELAKVFNSYVAQGLDISVEKVNELATGRTWVASKALELGLISGMASTVSSAIGQISNVKVISNVENSIMEDKETNESANVDVTTPTVVETENILNGETSNLETKQLANTVETPVVENQPTGEQPDANALERQRCLDLMTTFARDVEFATKAIASGISIDAAKVMYCDAVLAKAPAKNGADPVPFKESAKELPNWDEMCKRVAKEKSIKLHEAAVIVEREYPGLRKQAPVMF